MGKKIKALHPSYYSKFSCTGNACEDHCCKGWGIEIDKNTYMLYRKISDPTFSETFKEKIKRNKSETASDRRYAQFILTEDGVCPFFDGDGLCGIQKKHGHDYLCLTCQMYPRITGIIQKGISEISLTMSCPAAVRVALMQPEQITFEISEYELTAKDALTKAGLNTIDSDGAGGALIEYAWQIREACIDILQCRNMSLPDRFLAIGMLLNKLTEMEKSGEAKDAPDTAAAYVRMAKGGEFSGLLDTFAENEKWKAAMQLILMKYALAVSGQGGKKGYKYGTFRGFTQAIGGWMHGNNLEKVDYSGLYGFVKKACDEYWPDFLEKYSYILENYFVNLVFSKRFPFAYKELTPYRHFIALAEQYALIRILICVNAQSNGGMSEEIIMQTLMAMSVDAVHNKNAARIAEAYGGVGTDSLAHIYFLLR